MMLKTRVVENSESTSLHPNTDSIKSKGCKNISDITVQTEPRRGRNDTCTRITELENEDVADPTTLGVVDAFLTAQGPSSLTIETVSPTPNKATSEMVSL